MAVLGLVGLAVIFLVTAGAIRALLAHAGEGRWSVAACMATAAIAVGPALLGRVTADLRLSTWIFGAIALLALLAARSSPPVVEPIAHPAVRVSAGWGLLALLALGLVSWTVIIGHYFDEDALHFGLVGVIARGVLPPVHPLYPDLPFPYHYGFDVLAAEVMVFGRVSFEHAIDVVRIWSFLLLLGVSTSIGAALGGGKRSALAAVVIPMGGSLLSYFLWTGMAQLQMRWSELPPEWVHTPVPQVITNFFQPPLGLAMPLSLGALLLFDGTDRSELGRRRRLIAAAIYLGLFSLIQVVLFLILGFAAGVTSLIQAIRARAWRSLPFDLAVLSSALLIAWLIGGFFTGSVQPSQELVPGRTYFKDPWLRSVAHHLTVMGLPLALFPFAIYRAIRPGGLLRAALVAAVAVCLVVPNLGGYARDGSVVKFYMIGMFLLNVLFADLMMALLAQRFVSAKILGGVLIFLGATIGWVWLARTTVLDGRFGIQRWRENPPPPIARAVLDGLGPYLRPRDRVFTTNIELSKVGLLTPGFDPRRAGGGLYIIDWDRAITLLRHQSRARVDLQLSDLEALKVRFVVMSTGDIGGLSYEGVRALNDPARFEPMFRVTAGDHERFVYRVLGTGTATASAVGRPLD
ncbi:MAG: hypothetical protein IT384_02940 [Deltaproteobacteria bacterium]|nr:hypothetical protein [Deltaproteobacteria bacterium]